MPQRIDDVVRRARHRRPAHARGVRPQHHRVARRRRSPTPRVEAGRIGRVDVRTIHIVGGGALNELLCQRTADRSGLPVLAGPVEATALGNVLVQARAAGLVTGSLEALRDLVARTHAPRRYSRRAPEPVAGAVTRRQPRGRARGMLGVMALLGLEHPIVLGPFGGMSSVALTAAVSEAGGLGSYGLYGYSAARIAETAAQLHAATGRPFAAQPVGADRR